MEAQNDFMILRQTVNKAVRQYMDLRKRISWKDKGKSATIMRLAKPFQTGYFTIAVAGKMSSGKSTFINSLIGENLLPTGHFQTTSCITWIVSSDKRYMEVSYADGKKETFTENLAEELQKLVAVPKKFEHLPIHHLNILIKQGDNISEILKKKAGIEEMTKTTADDSLWKEYVSTTPKSKIPENVEIYLQLPKEYEGWRIVDTPGVGAVGGIQDATKKLLTSKEGDDRAYSIIDAVILLHNCKENIQDQTANEFAEDIRKSMGDLADGRLFFVMTHASDNDFLHHKETTLEIAETLFGTKLKIPKSRINYVDSLIHHFITSARNSKKDFSNLVSLQTPLEGWKEEDWEIMKNLLYPSYCKFMTSRKECTNSSLFAELESVSRFDSLRTMLYEFLNDEKSKAFSDLMSLIQSELQAYGKSLRKEIQAVSNGKAAIDKQIEEIEKEKTQLHIALGKIRDKVTKGVIEEKFSFIDREFQKLSQLESISDVRTAFLQVIEKGLSTEKEIFSSLIKEFESYVSKFNDSTTTFDALDFSQIERDATISATSQITDYNRPETETVCCGEDKKTYPHTKSHIDFEKKRREFTATVISKGRIQFNKFKKGLMHKIDSFYKIAADDIAEKTDAAISRLEYYKRNLANDDMLLSDLRSKLSGVNEALTQLEKFED